MSEDLKSLFPAAPDLPAESWLSEMLDQRKTLVAGELRAWEGETRSVYSAVHLRQQDGSMDRIKLGGIPAGGIADAEEALAAAVAAYRDGRGE